MAELQKSGDFASAMGKVLSGKPGYKAVIEKKRIQIKCSGCGMIYDSPMKFCPECGSRLEMPRKA
jgi:rRNA maturation endonuclease Nob1